MKIVATIGFNSFSEQKIQKILLAGVDALRYNFSFYSPEKNIEYIKNALTMVDNLNVKNIGILIDLPKNKLRLGIFPEEFYKVNEGQVIFLKCHAALRENEVSTLPVMTDRLDNKLLVGSQFTIGDGAILAKVVEQIDQQTVKIIALNNGYIQSGKSLNIRWKQDEEYLFKLYQDIIEKIKNIDAHLMISFPYINRQFTEKMTGLIKEIRAKNIVKIENYLDEEELGEMCRIPDTDLIMIDRGEIGTNEPFERIGVIQKNMVDTLLKFKKHVLISTLILDSTVNNYVPDRSNILDLTNLVLDGISGIILCGETGSGARPVYSINVAKRIIDEASKYQAKKLQTFSTKNSSLA